MNTGNTETSARLIISEKVLKNFLDIGKFNLDYKFCVKRECLKKSLVLTNIK